MPDTARPEEGAAASDLQSGTTSLVIEARSGSRSAFSRLVRMYQQDVFRMVYYRTRSPADAEDITQEIFLQAYRKLAGLRDAQRFRAWLYRIALNRVRDHHRRRRVQALFGQYDEEEAAAQSGAGMQDNPEAVNGLLKRDFWKQVGLFVERLSTMEREVFVLRFFDQLSIREIAGILKKGESTVKTHLYRSLSKFRAEPSLRDLCREKLG